jgi:hypothetical protein
VKELVASTFILSVCLIGALASRAGAAAEKPQVTPSPDATTEQVFRASDFLGATDTTIEGCHAWSGEYTVWVYATVNRCGVPREQADRVVVIREPLPGVAPIKAVSRLPGSTYAVWVFGNGSAENLSLKVCAKFCVIGKMPSTPGWAFLGWVETRDNQTLLLRPWQQPETRRLDLQAMVLSLSDAAPDWTP